MLKALETNIVKQCDFTGVYSFRKIELVRLSAKTIITARNEEKQ